MIFVEAPQLCRKIQYLSTPKLHSRPLRLALAPFQPGPPLTRQPPPPQKNANPSTARRFQSRTPAAFPSLQLHQPTISPNKQRHQPRPAAHKTPHPTPTIPAASAIEHPPPNSPSTQRPTSTPSSSGLPVRFPHYPIPKCHTRRPLPNLPPTPHCPTKKFPSSRYSHCQTPPTSPIFSVLQPASLPTAHQPCSFRRPPPISPIPATSKAQQTIRPPPNTRKIPPHRRPAPRTAAHPKTHRPDYRSPQRRRPPPPCNQRPPSNAKAHRSIPPQNQIIPDLVYKKRIFRKKYQKQHKKKHQEACSEGGSATH